MSLEKWLEGEDKKAERKKRQELFQKLPDEEKTELKKKGIQKLVKKETESSTEAEETSDILSDIIDFKNWLDSRTYLKGDLDKAEVWIGNLYKKFNPPNLSESIEEDLENKIKLKNKFREIPLEFLDEKTRIALNKRLRGMKRTGSDNYYLRKLQTEIKKKLKEAEYYHSLKKILNTFK